MDNELNRLEEVAEVLHETILNGDDEDKGMAIKALTDVERTITDRKKVLAETEKTRAEHEHAMMKAKIEQQRVSQEAPEEKTVWTKICDFGKSWGAVIAGGLTLGGVIIHEVVNRKNLDDVTHFEETGTYRSTSFRKWIK